MVCVERSNDNGEPMKSTANLHAAPAGRLPHRALGTGRIKVCLVVIFAAAAAAVASPASARAYHSQSLDGLVARCSTVNTTTLPRESLERYGVEPDDERGLLSCVVQKQKPGLRPENVQAQVDAEYSLTGQPPREIELREVRENNLVTYLGTYPVRTEGPLVFSIELQVDDARVEMNFDDQSPHL